jgi:hypothetical protein
MPLIIKRYRKWWIKNLPYTLCEKVESGYWRIIEAAAVMLQMSGQ